MTAQPTIWTVGYEGATLAGVLAALKEAGIAVLIDVRELPLSRRAGFSKRPLQAAAAEVGIEYLHLRALGTPKEGRLAARNGEHDRFWAIVEERLQSPEAAFDLQQAATVAAARPSCLLCFEADHAECHRDRVAELMAERYGFAVAHLAPLPVPP
jgi:uncharacterized protein (DUF488 family)